MTNNSMVAPNVVPIKRTDDRLIAALRDIWRASNEGLRLHLEQMPCADAPLVKIDAPTAIHALMDEYGVEEVARLVRLAALARGVQLELR